MSANTDLVKKPYSKEKFTSTQLQELARCTVDPKYFIKNFCYIQHPTKGRLKFELYGYQDRLVDVYHNYRYSIAMLPRQTGKSTCAAAYLLWYAMFKPDSVILIAAHKYSGAQEIMQRVRYMYEMCPDHIRAGATAYNKGSLEFDNGSRIVAQATTENTGRGMSITLVYLDEFAFVPPRVASEFWTSISPTLSTGGKCFITSTPNQDNDQFAQIWKQSNKTQDEYGNETEVGVNGFKSIVVNWREHPDRDEKWAAEEQGKIGEERFRREHGCEFITADETLINSLKLNIMETREPWKRTGQVRWYKPVDKTKTYIAGLDPSLGTGGDNAAIQIFELPNMKQVAEWKHNKTTITEQIRILKGMLHQIKDEAPDSEIYWSVENNTLGEAALVVIEEMGEENIPGTFLSQPKGNNINRRYRKGFTTTNKSKLSACSKLKTWVESERIEIASSALLRELKTFVARGAGFAAKDGETDDLVMALLLVVRITQEVAQYDEVTYNELRDTFSDEDDMAPMPFVFLT
tara:strand:+ start:7534 stop:9090 length:1557 start_codon:yes stop_codon:yes gene_type:complete